MQDDCIVKIKTPKKSKKREIIIPIGPSIAYVVLTQGKYCLIDSEDAYWIGRNNWHLAKNRSKDLFYAQRRTSEASRNKAVHLHREILNAGKHLHADHINGNGLDNRRCNLREATPFQNRVNVGISTNNSSGYKGVSWSKASNKWQSQICTNRKSFHLGFFSTLEEAHEAYCVAATKYHGDFARFA